MQALAEKYGALTGIERDPEAYRLLIACYPEPEADDVGSPEEERPDQETGVN